jgi:hypothetical protein
LYRRGALLTPYVGPTQHPPASHWDPTEPRAGNAGNRNGRDLNRRQMAAGRRVGRIPRGFTWGAPKTGPLTGVDQHMTVTLRYTRNSNPETRQPDNPTTSAKPHTSHPDPAKPQPSIPNPKLSPVTPTQGMGKGGATQGARLYTGKGVAIGKVTCPILKRLFRPESFEP